MIYTITSHCWGAGEVVVWHGYIRAGNGDWLYFLRGRHFSELVKYCRHRGWAIEQHRGNDNDAKLRV